MTAVNLPHNLPEIPGKRYFTIGEVSELCDVKTHVLRYWEQEFTQLRPVKRRGNRRYYQRHDVQLILLIRELLYSKGFTIQGAKLQLQDTRSAQTAVKLASQVVQGTAPAEGPDAGEDALWRLTVSDTLAELDEIVQLLSR